MFCVHHRALRWSPVQGRKFTVKLEAYKSFLRLRLFLYLTTLILKSVWSIQRTVVYIEQNRFHEGRFLLTLQCVLSLCANTKGWLVLIKLLDYTSCKNKHTHPSTTKKTKQKRKPNKTRPNTEQSDSLTHWHATSGDIFYRKIMQIYSSYESRERTPGKRKRGRLKG